VSDLGWFPPSPEGASNPDEMLSQFARITAILEQACDEGDKEMFRAALLALQTIFAHAVGELRRISSS
jgi:hypothetical protein